MSRALADVLAVILRDPGRPRLTWYGDGGERVELSGAVLVNWLHKTANLLVEEADAGPGTRVLLDLPGHWRTVVWALATWRVGACVVLPPDDDVSDLVPSDDAPVDLVVTDRPEAYGSAPALVAVALPALARRFDGPLPPGALDAAGVVLGYGDALGWVPPLDPAAPALVGPDAATTTHAALVPPAGARARRLLDAADLAVDALLREVLAALASDGSVVLVGGEAAAGVRADPARRAALVAQERITAS